jgi:pimeloyl-ACP methyl ester carboxylesterase
MSTTVETTTEIRPFQAEIPQAEVDELRRRLAATRWPEKETVGDASQGVPLARLKPLVEYWATDYDWRRAEAKLNALPQFVTQLDGLDIHFVHARSSHEDALPVIITHGWPGSIFELLKIVKPLTEPPDGKEAFHVVIPSLPGYGFSGRPDAPGWKPERIARAWDELMHRLGYDEYVAQGGDWGAVVTEAMGRQAPEGLRAIHVNLPASVPPDVEAALNGTGPVPELTDEEQAAFEGLAASRKSGYFGYFIALTARPQDVGYAVTDSPVGLAALFFWHPGFATWSFGSDPNDAKSKDEVLDDISLYWLTNTAASSGRLYWEHGGAFPTSAAAMKAAEISVPVGVTVFGEDGFRPPESWTRRAYPTLNYVNKVEKGGHFAAWEQPELFAEEVRATFKEVR